MADLIVLMGATGAGKSVQGDLLAKELDGVHLSSGNLLRTDPKAAVMIKNGKLAPASDVERIIGEALAKVPITQPVILDGFPRSMSNLYWMNDNLSQLGREIKSVVLIELDLETSLKRLGLRDRADDAPAAVKAKWDEYSSKTRPVIEYYEAKNLLRRIDGRGSVAEVQKLLRSVL